MMEEETEEIRIPATELAHDGGFLDRLLALLRKSLVGDFGSVFLHDPDHITVTSTWVGQDERCCMSKKTK